MRDLARHLLAVLVLLTTVIVIVPVWLTRTFSVPIALPRSGFELLAPSLGLAILVVGASLFAASLRRLGGEGGGTLAPWDPPTSLVVTGPHARVRNP